MVVISLSNCPLQLRGDLTKWLQEIDVGVYVGRLSARVREKIWERICDNIKSGRAIMVYSTNNEQGYAILTHNTIWHPKDYDGFSIMFKPKKCDDDVHSLKKGFSKAAKYQMAKYQKNHKSDKRNDDEEKNDKKSEYIIMDIETTGLDYDNDNIIEIGLLKIQDNEIKQQYQSFVKIDGSIPVKVTDLTGITQNTINAYGKEEKQVLDEVKAIVGNCIVVGYNIQFDVNFINKLCERHETSFFIKRTKDILRIVKRKLSLSNYKLETVCKHYGLETDGLHRALNDCILVYDIVKELNIIM